jgi:surfeit locus 1 family protein
MSEASKDRRFPIGLTIATLIAFAILCVLGGWQIKRLAWKEDLLARIEVLKTAPAVPLGPVLVAAARGHEASWVRVETDCKPAPANHLGPVPLVYGVRGGDIVWRAQAICELDGNAADTIMVDLGVVDALTGQSTPADLTFSPPTHVVGVLTGYRQLGGDERKHIIETAMGDKPALYVLMAERVSPKVPGVTPAPLPAEISNRHLEYALTWFGLAVTLLFIYAAMLWRKMRS